jgi:hypothetical protein
MAERRAKATSGVMQWWLFAGDEDCPHCGQTYLYELEFRCPECDSPGCPHCKAQHTEGHHVCPECLNTRQNMSTVRSRAHG